MLKRKNGNELYRTVLDVQNELNIHRNIYYLAENEKWKKAKKVLDLGCGPGYLIAELSRKFPDK